MTATLTVDLAAVAANTRLFAGLLVEVRAERASNPTHLMAVVKADGFGHGATDVARTALANGASWLGVTTVAEASMLRRHEITAPVLSWLNHVETDFETAVEQRIDLAVPSGSPPPRGGRGRSPARATG